MKYENKITEAEWKIMDVLWEKNPLNASEIIEKLQLKTTWHSKTIRTLLIRLVNKKMVKVEKMKLNVYSPLVSREEVQKVETEHFIDKVYNGSLGLLLSNYVKKESLTLKEIEMLKELIQKEEENND